MSSKIKVSVAQSATVRYDVDLTLDEVERLVKEAQSQGTSLCVFPEAFIGGYPRGSTFGAVIGSRTGEGREEFLRYHKAAIEVSPSAPAVLRLARVSRETQVFLVIGVIEREGGTLYCTAVFIDPDHGLVAKHRKLMPTASERLIWGFGDASTLPIVRPTLNSSRASAAKPKVEANLSAAICWENYVAPLRYHYFANGVQLYCAPTVDSRECWESSMRHIALEGRCFVLSACQFALRSDFPESHPVPPHLSAAADPNDPDGVMIGGGSMIVSPLGDVLAGPLRGEKGVLTVEVDLDDCVRGKFDLDATGHYARPDVFQVLVDGQAAGSKKDAFLVIPGR